MIEYNHRIQTVAVGMNRVVDVDVALGILADAVGVAVLNGARQLAPVMNRLVLIDTRLAREPGLCCRPYRLRSGMRGRKQPLRW
jgi:hypothetical protein